MLFEFYNVKNDEDLVQACENDWRFVLPSEIAVEGFIPRTPYVKFANDENWKTILNLEEKLIKAVELKRKPSRTTRRK